MRSSKTGPLCPEFRKVHLFVKASILKNLYRKLIKIRPYCYINGAIGVQHIVPSIQVMHIHNHIKILFSADFSLEKYEKCKNLLFIDQVRFQQPSLLAENISVQQTSSEYRKSFR